MIQILDERYSSMQSIQPLYNALAVFSVEAAFHAFKHLSLDFVFAMNEKTGKFVPCNSVTEVEHFLGVVQEDNITCKLNRIPKRCCIIQTTTFKTCDGCGHYKPV